MVSVGSEERSIIIIAIVVVVILGGAFAYSMVSTNAAEDKLIGDWYCVTSEKYDLGGEYNSEKYEENDFTLLTIKGVQGDLFYGLYCGTEIAGYRASDGTIEFRSLISGEFYLILKAYMDPKDENIMYVIETKYIENTDLIAVGYYACAKDVAKVPVVNSMRSRGDASIMGDWKGDMSQCYIMAPDGEKSVDGQWSIEITEAHDNVFKGTTHSTKDGAVVERSIYGVHFSTKVDGWIEGMTIDASLSSYDLYWTEDVIFMNRTYYSVERDSICGIELCYTRDGAVAPTKVAKVSYVGKFYETVSETRMDSQGTVTQDNDYTMEFVNESESKVIATTVNDVGRITYKCVFCFSLDDDSNVKTSDSISRLYNTGGVYYNVYGYAVHSLDCETITYYGMFVGNNGLWTSIVIVFEEVQE